MYGQRFCPPSPLADMSAKIVTLKEYTECWLVRILLLKIQTDLAVTHATLTKLIVQHLESKEEPRPTGPKKNWQYNYSFIRKSVPDDISKYKETTCL